jgi:hypothetical protein
VQRLIATGMSDCAIARETGIPRKTVRERRCNPPIRARPTASSACGIDDDFTALSPAYCYLLGPLSRRRLYLAERPRLEITNHLRRKLPGHHCPLLPSDRHSDAGTARGNPTSSQSLHRGLAVLEAVATSLSAARSRQKHLRPIRLEAWQEVLVKQATRTSFAACSIAMGAVWWPMIAVYEASGTDLTTSDGCSAPRSTRIPWTTPGRYQVAVYRKAAVARLDEFVGPKS